MAELRDLDIGRRRVLPARLLRARTTRSSGPGGQNVNKVATKVDLRLDLESAAELLTEDAMARIRAKLASRIDAEGWLRVTSGEHRTRGRNLEAALDRMEALLRDALRPRRKRKATRPSRASRERRLAAKQKRGAVKKLRRSDPRDD